MATIKVTDKQNLYFWMLDTYTNILKVSSSYFCFDIVLEKPTEWYLLF